METVSVVINSPVVLVSLGASAAGDISIKRREGLTVQFVVKQSDGTAVDLSSANLWFAIKRTKSDAATLVEKSGDDFVKTDAASGVVSTTLLPSETDMTGSYIGELKIGFDANTVAKSHDIPITITEAVTR